MSGDMMVVWVGKVVVPSANREVRENQSLKRQSVSFSAHFLLNARHNLLSGLDVLSTEIISQDLAIQSLTSNRTFRDQGRCLAANARPGARA